MHGCDEDDVPPAVIAEGRKHDAAMTKAPWRDCCHDQPEEHPCRLLYASGGEQVVGSLVMDGIIEGVPESGRPPKADLAGIAWMRTNLRALLDGYEEIRKQRDALRVAVNETCASITRETRELEALRTEVQRLRAIDPNWTLVEAIAQRDALLRMTVQDQATIRELRAEVDRLPAKRRANSRTWTFDEIAFICMEMQRWHDQDLAHEQMCMCCLDEMHTPSDLEPTPLCNLCAQRLAGDVPSLVSKLAAMKPVIDAAIGWKDCTSKGLGSHRELALYEAVRAYMKEPGR